ncbi:SIR2 family protein [Erysipelothrix rhusiopathiae]|nr:SIR2 family protein [Erysipelothrix rhusiopathiae]
MTRTCIDDIVKSKRLPVLFIGSGLSKRYIKKSPTWEDLLKECFTIVDPSEITYTRLIEKCTRERMSVFETNQHLGTEVEGYYNNYFFDKLKSEGTPAPSWAKTTSPFKMYLAQRFKDIELCDNPNSSHLKEEQQLLKQLNEKISAVITTNYDKFIEDILFNDGFDVYYKQGDLFKSDRFNVGEIYKIHGCIDNPSSLVFTKNDYDEFRKNRRLIIAKMLTLFSDSPIIFLGYSLEDENIREIILDFLDCIEPDDIPKLKNHFIFIEYKKNEREFIETTENIITDRGNIPITKISTDNFTRLFYILNKITPGLPSNVVKNTKRLIKKIVESSLETGNTNAIVINDDLISNLSNENIAVAFGEKQSLISRHGYTSFNLIHLFEDILFDNKNYDAHSVIHDRLSGTSYKTLIPIFKYYSKLSEQEILQNQHIEKFLVRNSYDTIFATNIKKHFKNIPIFQSIAEIESHIDELNEVRIDTIFKIFSKSLTNLSASDIRSFSIQYFNVDKHQCYGSTFFKRTVMYLDVLENKKT